MKPPFSLFLFVAALGFIFACGDKTPASNSMLEQATIMAAFSQSEGKLIEKYGTKLAKDLNAEERHEIAVLLVHKLIDDVRYEELLKIGCLGSAVEQEDKKECQQALAQCLGGVQNIGSSEIIAKKKARLSEVEKEMEEALGKSNFETKALLSLPSSLSDLVKKMNTISCDNNKDDYRARSMDFLMEFAQKYGPFIAKPIVSALLGDERT